MIDMSVGMTRCQIRFLGGKLGKALAEEFEASTVGDLLFVMAETSAVFMANTSVGLSV